MEGEYYCSECNEFYSKEEVEDGEGENEGKCICPECGEVVEVEGG